jgi:hypothetical protein
MLATVVLNFVAELSDLIHPHRRTTRHEALDGVQVV